MRVSLLERSSMLKKTAPNWLLPLPVGFLWIVLGGVILLVIGWTSDQSVDKEMPGAVLPATDRGEREVSRFAKDDIVATRPSPASSADEKGVPAAGSRIPVPTMRRASPEKPQTRAQPHHHIEAIAGCRSKCAFSGAATGMNKGYAAKEAPVVTADLPPIAAYIPVSPIPEYRGRAYLVPRLQFRRFIAP
jgi:hypothetical protein